MRLKRYIISLLAVMWIGGSMTAIAAPSTTVAASSCTSSFLGFPAWYDGLLDKDCNVKSPTGKDGLSKFIWHIALNIVEIALVAVIYISAIFTLFGGFMFMTSQGKPENAAKARMTMLDAVIGLIISFIAVGAVNFIISSLEK